MTDVCTSDYSIDETVNERTKKTTIFIWFCSAMSVYVVLSTRMTIPSSFFFFSTTTAKKNCVAAPFARTAHNRCWRRVQLYSHTWTFAINAKVWMGQTVRQHWLTQNEKRVESKCQINALRMKSTNLVYSTWTVNDEQTNSISSSSFPLWMILYFCEFHWGKTTC